MDDDNDWSTNDNDWSGNHYDDWSASHVDNDWTANHEHHDWSANHEHHDWSANHVDNDWTANHEHHDWSANHEHHDWSANHVDNDWTATHKHDWSASHEDSKSPHHSDMKDLSNEICNFKSETGTFDQACAHMKENTSSGSINCQPKNSTVISDTGKNDNKKHHDDSADDKKHRDESVEEDNLILVLEEVMLLDGILNDSKYDSEFFRGTLSFGNVTTVQSQPSSSIKSSGMVQEGDISCKRRENSSSVGNKEVYRKEISTSAGNKEVCIMPLLKFDVISARIIEIENERKHVVYTVMIRKDGTYPDTNPAVIERRYTEFLELYQCLRLENPSLMSSVIFPKKVLLGNFDGKLISERSICFEIFLKHAASHEKLRNSSCFNKFMQHRELTEARRWMEQKQYDKAVPLLESCFRLLDKIHTDRHPEVILALCRLVACCNANPFGTSAEPFAELALRRYEAVSDTDLLKYYIPLLQLCIHLWWQLGKDRKLLEKRLEDLKHRGISVDGCPSLMNALIKDGII